MPHLLGYARVSTADQNPDLQHDALKAVGCYRIFVDTASGALDERPALVKVLDQLRPGDTLVVWKLDRLGRSLRHLIDTIAAPAGRAIRRRGAHTLLHAPRAEYGARRRSPHALSPSRGHSRVPAGAPVGIGCTSCRRGGRPQGGRGTGPSC